MLRRTVEPALGSRAALAGRSIGWPSWVLTDRQLCDLELLATGAFAPLKTYLNREDYAGVCASMRLADGTLWPLPITLDVSADIVLAAESAGRLALRDPEGTMLAILHVDGAWQPDRRAEAVAVFGTDDELHPGVAYLLRRTNPWYVSGQLEVVGPPEHHDFLDLRRTPAEVKAEIARRGWDRVVAFQTRNPMHRAHQELTVRAARTADANLLLHPVVGIGKPGDIDVHTRVRCYRALLPSYPAGTVLLSLLPLAMRMAGPREALWHAIIRKNFGATHFIVGRDHAGPGSDSRGRPFYSPYDAQRLVAEHAAEVGVRMLAFPRIVYRADIGVYCPEDQVPPGVRVRSLSGTELRQRLSEGRGIPKWFTPPEVASELRRSHPPRRKRGFTVFFTGLSGAGKSTIATTLFALLRERDARPVTLLDGDRVRQHLSAGLGFSRADRDRNIERIGFFAAEITRHRGIAVCAPIAPYDLARREVRRTVEESGGFVLVYVATSLDVCESRDRKGLYAKARAGVITEFTGVTDVYEEPGDADLVIDTARQSAHQAAQSIIALLERLGYLSGAGSGASRPAYSVGT
ncbi:MAG: bifunctional sulfate adenylyltransferase/adenylylsulfate kinase [Actinomycetota bacterium]|nr:bifunctional sulfate adenylyltransferase/adenylylsulfate kinase [Actinomycetota bacterium]